MSQTEIPAARLEGMGEMSALTPPWAVFWTHWKMLSHWWNQTVTLHPSQGLPHDHSGHHLELLYVQAHLPHKKLSKIHPLNPAPLSSQQPYLHSHPSQTPTSPYTPHPKMHSPTANHLTLKFSANWSCTFNRGRRRWRGWVDFFSFTGVRKEVN